MDTKEEVKTPFKLKDQINYKSGDVEFRKVYSNDNGQVMLVAIDHKAVIARHQVPFDVMAYVLEGSVEFEVGDQRHKLDCCDAILLPSETPHTVTALDSAKILLTKIKA